MANVFGQQPWTRSTNDTTKPHGPRRISTPAGYRLSAIMGQGMSSPASSWSQEKGTPVLPPVNPSTEDLIDSDWKEGVESEPASAKTASTPQAYAVSTFSRDSFRTEDEPATHQNRDRSGFIASMGRKRVLISLGIVIVILLALVIGLAIGIGHSSSKSTSNDQALSSSPSATPSGVSSSAPSATTSTVPIPDLPKGFPVGTYSMIVFLDTVNTNCTNDAASWTCAPDVTYNENPVKAEATFLFDISGSPGSYQIEPSQTFSLSTELDALPFPLKLVDEGQPDERYKFQTSYYRNTTTNLNGTNAICTFPSTTFTGYLYTKMGKTYPLDGQTLPPTSNANWPFRMTFESDNGGGSGASVSCMNADTHETIHAVQPSAFGELCSCFYRNWRPPIPT